MSCEHRVIAKNSDRTEWRCLACFLEFHPEPPKVKIEEESRCCDKPAGAQCKHMLEDMDEVHDPTGHFCCEKKCPGFSRTPVGEEVDAVHGELRLHMHEEREFREALLHFIGIKILKGHNSPALESLRSRFLPPSPDA